MKRSIWWWTRVQNLKWYRHIVPPPLEIIMLDASLEEWGAHYPDQVAQGHWHFWQQGAVSHMLVLRAAFQTLLAFSPLFKEKKHPATHRQQSGGSLHKEAGKHKESHTHDGGTTGLRYICRIWRLYMFQQYRTNWLTISPSLLTPDADLGHAWYRSGSNPNEWQVSKIPGLSDASNSSRGRFPAPTLELPAGIYISPPIPLIARFLFSLGRSTSTVIAKKTVVHIHSTTEYGGSLTSSSDTGSVLTKPISTPGTRKTTPDGLEIEKDAHLMW